ncbi:MAG: ABC-2 family transporter protein [Gemmataceae bacterium]
MQAAGRYFRLWGALARYSLTRELAFRFNFLVKVFVELLWLTILLVFYHTIFTKTDNVASWDREQYLFFVGCYFTLGGILETFFLDNCNNFADLVRTGDLDFYLLKPIDEQFLISCRTIDWSCVPNVLMGVGVMIVAVWQGGWSIDIATVLLFVAVFLCGVALAYGFLLLMTAASVWFMRNQSLFEMWWLFTTLMRYPREIFSRTWAAPVGWIFSFVIPIMLVTNVPARVMLRAIEPGMLAYVAGATIVVLWASRRFFKYALLRYRSASS